jgi:SMODS and SLOG-associating 2TM effector domain 1/SMODS and SLOG-associating 2TM effector domain 3
MSSNVEIEKNFSSYFTQSDTISVNSQKKYMRAFKGTIIPLIVAAGINCITSLISENFKMLILILNIGIIISIIISIFYSIVVHLSKLQKFWYEGRAVAESIKTMSWKYLNCVTPFENDQDSKKVENQFINDLRYILETYHEILEHINCSNKHDPVIITTEMKEFRKIAWVDKKDIYLNQRIKKQRDWYLSKTKINSTHKNKWFAVAVILQVLSLLSIFYVVENSSVSSNLVGFFASASTSIVSWIQVKRYQELQQAYSTTALELDIIYHQGTQIEFEDDFLKFVEDAEKAISREHTLWIARRDHSRLKELLQNE